MRCSINTFTHRLNLISITSNNSSHSTNPPVATPASQPGPASSFNPDEMLQQMKNTVESSLQAMVEKTQERQAHLPPTPTPPDTMPPPNISHPPPHVEHPQLAQISLPPPPLLITEARQTSNLRPSKSPSSTLTSTSPAIFKTSLHLQRCVHSQKGFPTTRSSTIHHSSISLSTTSSRTVQARGTASATRLLLHKTNSSSRNLVDK